MFECRVEPLEKQLLPYCGMPVCLLMKDGRRIVGRMTACRKGALILNGDSLNKPATAAFSRSTAGRRAKRTRIQSRNRKPQTTANLPFVPVEPLAPFGPIEPLAPLRLEPPAWGTAKSDQVPLRTIESVLIL